MSDITIIKRLVIETGLTIIMYKIRQTKAMKLRWLPEKSKLIRLVASDDDTRNQLT